MVGIVSYGGYIPFHRIQTKDIAEVWGKSASSITSSLGVAEKSVAALDEDAVTLALESTWEALARCNVKAHELTSILVGSESHPYAVNPTSTIVAEFLGTGNNYFSVDLQFACKAATTGLILTCALLNSQKINYGLVIGSDCAQAKPHDVLEYTAASASAAFILGSKSTEIVAEILDSVSFSSDTPDFWRRDGISYPSHGGRFTGEPAYFTHVLGAAKLLFAKTKLTPRDFAKCVFHMPNGKFPLLGAKRLGFTYEQIKDSLIVRDIGNPYTASALLGLIKTLDATPPGKLICLISYGSGAGSDAFVLRTTKNITKMQGERWKLTHKMSHKHYISYAQYLKLRGVI